MQRCSFGFASVRAMQLFPNKNEAPGQPPGVFESYS